MSFLHGIEHIDLETDNGVVNDIVTAVIGLIGTAEQGETNKLTLCKNAKDDVQFGNEGTIPEALKAIRMQDSQRGSALVIVINVGKPECEDIVENIVGEISELGERTGLQLFETALTEYGFEPMVYIAPRYSWNTTILNELIRITNKTETMAYIDTPDSMTFDNAIKSRNNDGQFAKLTKGQKLLFPHFLVANPDYNSEDAEPAEQYLNVPMSAYCAGLRAKVDLEEGWHVSTSNHRITGVEGTDIKLTFSLGDTTSEANLLNAAGIVTAVNLNGLVEWGNYSAGYPGNLNPDAFECVRRTRCIMKRTIQEACISFIDKPFIKANVDAIRNTINQYLNKLTAEGKIVYGQCFYKSENNPVNDLAQGHLTFDIEFTPALPMQRLTFTYKIDLNQLSTIA